MIKAVLFDFGGVLSEQGKGGFVGRVLAELYDVPVARLYETRDLHRAFRRGHIASADYFAALNQRLGGNVTEAQFLRRADYPTLSQNVYDLAAALRAHGIKTAIFSNIFDINARELRKRGCYAGFDPVILSCEQGCAKPEPAFYQVALRKLDVQPEEILLIDDQEKCLPPARERGMHTILARTPEQIVADTKQLIARENNLSV